MAGRRAGSATGFRPGPSQSVSLPLAWMVQIRRGCDRPLTFLDPTAGTGISEKRCLYRLESPTSLRPPGRQQSFTERVVNRSSMPGHPVRKPWIQCLTAHPRQGSKGVVLVALPLSIVSRMRGTPRSTRLPTCVANSSNRSAPSAQAAPCSSAGISGVTARWNRA